MMNKYESRLYPIKKDSEIHSTKNAPAYAERVGSSEMVYVNTP
jgi:hypothetical protein